MIAKRLSLLAAVCSVMLSFGAILPRATAQTGMVDMSGMSDEQAKSHFKVGKTLYEAGRFAEAAAEFEKAYALSKKEPLLYNIYVAYRDASDLPHAIEALRSFLNSAKLEPDERVNLQARLRAMEEANSRAEVAQAAAQAPAAPAPAPAPAPEIAAPPPAPVAPSAPSPAAAPEHSSSPVPYVLAIGGGTLLLGGVVTGLVASSKIGSIEDDCKNDTCPKGYGIDDKRSDARTWRTVAFVLTGAGVVTAAVGAVLLLTQDDGSESTQTSAAFDCGPTGCSVHGRF